MSEKMIIYSAAPVRPRVRRVIAIDEAFGGRFLRRRSFWAGRGGVITTICMGLLVVALLVGWVLLWVNRPEGPSLILLVLGCVAFTLLLAMLATVQNRLTTYWRLREAQAAYLAGVSHNLRTPISAIRAAAQALERPGVEPGNQRRLLDAIVQETRRLGLRVDNVLETGRLEVERAAFDVGSVDFSTMVADAGLEAKSLAETRQGGVSSVVEKDIWVQGDTRALRLIVDNLLDNAFKYSPGKPEITISLALHQGFALLQVIDDGIGMDPRDLPKSFKRFWRGDQQRGGTGLGLSLAQAIARAHNGDLFVHSKGLGHGVAVECWLPREDCSED